MAVTSYLAATAPVERTPVSVINAPSIPDRGTRRAAWARWGARHPALTEVGILLATYVVYAIVRTAANDDMGQAQAMANALLRMESATGLDVEADANAALVAIPWLATATAIWYVSLHYLVTVTLLVTLYRRFPLHYRPLRRGLLGATMTALVFYVLMPTAPPRLMPEGYVDVVRETFLPGAAVPTGEREGLSALTNQLAAFPSMHAGWALWAAIAIWVITRSLWWRLGAAAYALVTAVVVVITANHWVIDVIAGWAIVALAYVVLRRARAGSGSPPASLPQHS